MTWRGDWALTVTLCIEDRTSLLQLRGLETGYSY